jgi:hypothetical protein
MIFGIQSWFGFCQIGSSYGPDLVIAFGDKHIIIFPKTWGKTTQVMEGISEAYTLTHLHGYIFPNLPTNLQDY